MTEEPSSLLLRNKDTTPGPGARTHSAWVREGTCGAIVPTSKLGLWCLSGRYMPGCGEHMGRQKPRQGAGKQKFSKDNRLQRCEAAESTRGPQSCCRPGLVSTAGAGSPVMSEDSFQGIPQKVTQDAPEPSQLLQLRWMPASGETHQHPVFIWGWLR